ncbi:histidine kinase [Kitasatospora sp. NPDC089797]|uniref:sensor histidine kinase n=1 Tax=Kitasatospora sp. NPDC089797 TaxID=3155298 RepID=UPI0034190237
MLLAPVGLAHPGDHGAALLLALTAGSVAAVALLPWPLGRVTLAAAAGAVAGLSLLLDLGYSGFYRLPAFWLPFEWLALLGVLFRSVRGLPDRWAGPVGATVGLAAVVLPLRFALRMPHGGGAGPVAAVLLSLLPVLAAAGAGLYLRVLEARREHAVARARREQRLDVARGLHDSVAHEITGIVLEAQAGQLPGQEPAETTALLRRLEEAGLRALDSMDEMVGALRAGSPESPGSPGPRDTPSGVPGSTGDPGDRGGPEPAVGTTRWPGQAELPELVARFGATGGLRATAELAPGAAALLTAEAEATAYAVVLESLTNIRRHAPQATSVVVRVVVGPDGNSVLVRVGDDGGPTTRPSRLRRRPGAGGTGLAGLTARVAAHGGALSAGPLGPSGSSGPSGASGPSGPSGPSGRSGWEVVCTLPGR